MTVYQLVRRLAQARRRLAVAARTERIVGEMVEAATGKAATPGNTEKGDRTIGG